MNGDDLYRLDIDYDVLRWIEIPETHTRPAGWSHDVAVEWATDLGRLTDRNWPEVLELMLEHFAQASYSTEPEAVLIHVLTPADRAPDLALVTVVLFRDANPAALMADDSADTFAAETIERPERTTVDTDAGPVEVTLCHFREEDGSVRVQLCVLRKIHDEIVAMMTASSYDIPRILCMQDEMIALAQQLSIEWAAEQ